MKKKKISIATSCFNEAGNIQEFYDRIKKVFKKLKKYDYEFIVADNYSTDGTREILRKIASKDKKFKVILNSNNFGHIRSPMNAYLQGTGDATITMVSDLQEPPELIPQLIKQWEQGYQCVVAVKQGSKENLFMSTIRRFYYWLLEKCSDTGKTIQNFTGFGLYDHKFIEAMKSFNDPYPYYRGIVSEIGFKRGQIYYIQQARKHGKTKNNLFTLYDMGMTGFVNHSKLPLRLAAFMGFFLSFLSLLVAIGYFIYKIMYWDTFSLGMAPVVVGLFFFAAVQLIFIGIIGEYIGAIYTQVRNRPLVIEEEKLNFDK